MTATNIQPGDIVVYTGSVAALHGPAVYRSFCYCDHCDGGELRFVLIHADDEPLIHVGRTSFTLPAEPLRVSNELAAIADGIRERQKRIDAQTARLNVGRRPEQFFSLNDSIPA